MALTAEQQKMVSEMQAAENARMNSRLKDIGTGVLKGNTTDFLNTLETGVTASNPVLGLITNSMKKAVGLDKPLGDQVLEGVTGLESNTTAEQEAGSLISFGGAGKALAGKAAVVASTIGAHLLARKALTGAATGTGSDVITQLSQRGMIIPALPDLYKKVLTRSAEGASKAETFNELGGYKDLDKHVKTILSDAGASIKDAGLAKLQAGKTVTAEELVDHPELFAALPQLKSMNIDAFKPGDKRLGSMTGSKEMALNVDQKDKDLLSTFLHESQHAIQSLFNWAKGSNVQMHLPSDMPARKQAIIDLHTSGKNEEARALQTEYNNLQTEARRRYENSRGEQEARFTQMGMDLDLENLGAKLLAVLKRGDTPQTHDTKLIRNLPAKP